MTPRSHSRRDLLRTAGVAAFALPTAVLITACGGDSGGDSSSGDSGGDAVALPDDVVLATRWVPTELAPGSQRLPVSLATAAGLMSEGPARLTGKVVDYDTGEVLVDGLFADRRTLGEGTTPFYVFRTALTSPGVYGLAVDGGPSEPTAFQVRAADELPVARAGESLPAFDTPTVDDPRGVDPICSREPEPCPFHSITLTEALASGKPVVYMVGTPAHCQTGVCGPVLEQMIALADELGDSAVFVHADVYADDAATVVAPAVEAAMLTFEPVVWITDGTGTIVERLDAVWDANEIREALS
ncbi:MAG: hypothetical protein B7C54_01175 [Acidimicrobiales bacterium mtb01]|nr:hypothetical protein [Actinomycetota bacterium]TEX48371.1 MAG: hypothetical protein B7C54_01175 [Acidimicrobiales bacterium mtb01]